MTKIRLSDYYGGENNASYFNDDRNALWREPLTAGGHRSKGCPCTARGAKLHVKPEELYAG